MAEKTTSGSGFRPYSCSPPSTWLIQPKIAKIFQGHFLKEIFGVKVEKFKNILNELQAGLYLSNFIRGGVEVLAIEVDDRANA